MRSTHKKVIVRKMDRDSITGYVSPEYLVDGKVEVLNTSGKVISIDLAEVKGVYFVRDFNEGDAVMRKTFTTRPRTEGLWVRVRFRDNDVLEGMMSNDLTQMPAEGYLVSPPDTRANTQRIFVPRSALTELMVLAVIGGPASRRRKPEAAVVEQVPMFSE